MSAKIIDADGKIKNTFRVNDTCTRKMCVKMNIPMDGGCCATFCDQYQFCCNNTSMYNCFCTFLKCT